MLVIEHDAAEVAVEAIVDISHVGSFTRCRIINSTAGNDVAGNGKSRRHIVSTRLSDDVNVWWKILIERLTENTCHVLESVTTKTTTDIQGVQVKAVGVGLLEDHICILNCFQEGKRVRSARAYVEANTNDIKSKLLSEGQEAISIIQRCSKLQAQAAQARGVISQDTQEQLCVGEQLRNLAELIGIVKCHLLDSLAGDIAHVRVGLARLGIDDTSRVNTNVEHLLDFSLRGTIEASAQPSKKLDNLGVRVTLDRYRDKLVIKSI